MKRVLVGLGMLALTSCGQLPCECIEPEVRVLIYDSNTAAGIPNVTVESDPPVTFSCTEYADETECVGTAPSTGPMQIFVTAPGYHSTQVQGNVEAPNTELVCDCGGLSLSVPLDAF